MPAQRWDTWPCHRLPPTQNPGQEILCVCDIFWKCDISGPRKILRPAWVWIFLAPHPDRGLQGNPEPLTINLSSHGRRPTGKSWLAYDSAVRFLSPTDGGPRENPGWLKNQMSSSQGRWPTGKSCFKKSCEAVRCDISAPPKNPPSCLGVSVCH